MQLVSFIQRVLTLCNEYLLYIMTAYYMQRLLYATNTYFMQWVLTLHDEYLYTQRVFTL